MSYRRILSFVSVLAVYAAFVTACDNDDTVSPTQRLDLVDFISDANGLASKMVLDNGDTLSLVTPASGFASDTVCRCLAVFRPESELTPDIVKVTSIGQVITLPPMHYNTIYIAPAGVTSVWRGGNYLNLRLWLRTKGSAHSFGFAYIGNTTADDGAQTFHLMLYNNSGTDEEYFSRTVYLSCALKSVMDIMQCGRDSVAISINEYDHGFVTYRLPL